MENSITSVEPAPNPEPDGKSAAAVHVPHYSYYALTVLTLVNFLNYIDRQMVPAVATSMQSDLHLSDTELGAMEAALLISFTVLAPLFGWLGDRWSRTKLMASAAVVWSVATGLTAIIDHSPLLPPGVRTHLPLVELPLALSGVGLAICFVRAFVGIGESSYSTITPTLIADYFPPQRRATALGVFQIAIPMGFALGLFIGAILDHFFGWRVAFMIVGLPGLITAGILWKLREPERGKTETQHAVSSRAADREPWLRTCVRIFTTRDWLLSTAGYTALTFVLGAFATWAKKLLETDKHMGKLSSGIVIGAITLVAGFVGSYGGGKLADRIAAKRSNGYFLVCAASSLLGIVPAVLALALHRPIFFLPAIFLVVAFLFANNAPFHAILVGSVPPSIRATAMALNIVTIHLLGDVISRFGVGVLSDSLAVGRLPMLAGLARIVGLDPIREHLTSALLVVPLGLLVSALIFFWGGRGAAAKAA